MRIYRPLVAPRCRSKWHPILPRRRWSLGPSWTARGLITAEACSLRRTVFKGRRQPASAQPFRRGSSEDFWTYRHSRGCWLWQTLTTYPKTAVITFNGSVIDTNHRDTAEAIEVVAPKALYPRLAMDELQAALSLENALNAIPVRGSLVKVPPAPSRLVVRRHGGRHWWGHSSMMHFFLFGTRMTSRLLVDCNG